MGIRIFILLQLSFIHSNNTSLFQYLCICHLNLFSFYSISCGDTGVQQLWWPAKFPPYKYGVATNGGNTEDIVCLTLYGSWP